MYICERCGKIHEELPTYEEDFGYDVGIGRVSAWRTMVDTCDCGGNIVDGAECEECGEVFEKSGEQTICGKCLEKYKTLDNALKIGAEWKHRVEINSFFTKCFSIEQIEEILERELREADKLNSLKNEIEDFIDNEYLSDWVKGGNYEL